MGRMEINKQTSGTRQNIVHVHIKMYHHRMKKPKIRRCRFLIGTRHTEFARKGRRHTVCMHAPVAKPNIFAVLNV